ncbi:MAG TPA: biotin/lipoyl-containing protein, partial [Candidatus Thermoplasmatota archaeon]|nr:biotin/lipoyl-containing protein [Candidatus Thermoplasmatota archaeon]
MAFEFKLPDVGEGIHEGEIVKWHVKAGEPVKEDQLIVEVMTDKATVEITSPKAGRIGQLLAKEGQVAKVGDVIVTIEEGAVGAKPAPAAAKAAHAPEQKEEKTLFELPKELGGVNPFKKQGGASTHAPTPAPATTARTNGPVSHPAGRPIAAPAVRRKAREMGIELSSVRGSGPVGRILHQDLEHAGGAPAAAATTRAGPPSTAPTQHGPVAITAHGPVEVVAMKGLRKKIAENMARSKHIAAHYTYVEEVDATELVSLRDFAQASAQQRGVKLTYLP